MEGSSSSYTFSRARMDSRSPPSPAASSPSLTQSASNSSSSPPQPTTPPRQPKPRYPDLGRVPLHRRGTSQTYERLEDLLREAGYKETRIFTPESDKRRLGGRGQGEEDDESGSSKKQGVGAAVVGFLAGLVTGGNANTTGTGANTSSTGGSGSLRQRESDDNPDLRPRISRTQSPSPLADKQQHRGREDEGSRTSAAEESSELQTPLMTSSIESLNDPTPKAYRRQTSQSYYTQHYSRPSSRPTTPSAYHQYQHQQQHQHQAPLRASTTQYQRYQVSAAQRHLQHQASRSSIHTNYATAAATVNLNHQGTASNGSSDGNFGGNVNVNAIQHPRPSRAGTYLRHMVSTSSVPHPLPPRPSSTPVQHRNFQVEGDSSDAETTCRPALPRNWLDNVARAILFGVASTGASTTSSSPPFSSSSHLAPHHAHQQRPLRTSRSSLSQTTIARNNGKANSRRSGLADQTNTVPPPPSVPPALFARLERGRASSSQSVLRAQVTCRSAPASRSSSVVRGGGGFGTEKGRDGESKGKGSSRKHLKENDGISGTRKRQHPPTTRKQDKKGKAKKKKKSKSKTDEKPCVPSLARTRIEGDGWHSLRGTSSSSSTRKNSTIFSDTEHRFFSSPDFDYHPTSSGYSTSANSYSLDSSASADSSDYSFSDSDVDSDEDEGELTLARMLVPPKRQHSIQSLRKHLRLNLTTSPPPRHSHSHSSFAAITTTTPAIAGDNPGPNLNPSLSRLRQLHNSSSTATLRSHSGTTVAVNGRAVSLSTAQSRTEGVAAVGEWEHEWRRGKYSSRRSSEDDDEVESLTWLSRDDVTTTTGGGGSQRSMAKGKSRLGLPSPWNTTTAFAS
ncbi:hypothetical protein D9756_008233 [Leucocoprinus leucothites]|uniref:Uncharacterized protein n=1 Tax=Leucocoprinus leucothites TaxID=201217 RepID=A0A8H5D0U4_9AGAR|nr:hypothetical protein D9756_008233 [Leucoagaricus leucothites]